MRSIAKRLSALCLCAFLTAAPAADGLAALAADAGTVHIASAREFKAFAAKCVSNTYSQGLRVVLDKKLAIAADAMSVVAGITLVVAAVQFISPRVNTIASIMTFTNNAQTMADLSSAIYGTAALLIAVVLNIIAAFTNVNEQ